MWLFVIYSLIPIVLLSLAAATSHASTKPTIDDYTKKRQERVMEFKRSKCPSTNVIERRVCIDQLKQEIEKAFPERGSHGYCTDHYSNLSQDEAKKVIDELQKNESQAREMSTLTTPEPGEVMKHQFRSEVLWIEKNILKVQILETKRKF